MGICSKLRRFQVLKIVDVNLMIYFLEMNGFKEALAILQKFCHWTFLKFRCSKIFKISEKSNGRIMDR